MSIEGIFPALLTAFDGKGAIDEAGLRRLVGYQVEAGANGFFVCGSAGEGVYMTPAERRRVIEIVASEVSGQVPIMAHVGAMSTDEAVGLARDAREAGAAAIASMPPLVFRQPWPAIIEHLRAIAEAAELPTYYYHIPIITNVDVTADEVAEMVDRIPGLAGLKYSSPDLFLLWGVLERPRRRIEAFYGCDQQIYQGLLTGACGGIGSTYNYQIENVVQLYRAFKRGDQAEALRWQDKINKVVEVVFKYGGTRGVEKAMMFLRGYDVGPPRRPGAPFPAERLPEMRRDMERAGIL
ncbi:MAG TPA: dihydrodipicolinate synthase family protein [Candidatus Hydrogenedentes bacterium]|nr:dihydrodipicolinate synthase family protein [Candidatus Hydrogenedentota bacterium]